MKDKLRNIFKTIAENKEQIVFIVLAVVAVYRGYLVLFSPPLPQEPPPPRPKSTVDGVALPNPPPPPVLNIPGNYSSIYRENPFWYHAKKATGKGPESAEENINIQLLDIKNGQARLQSVSLKGWYPEGAEFEEYKLVEINESEKSVVIYSERNSKRKTLTMQ